MGKLERRRVLKAAAGLMGSVGGFAVLLATYARSAGARAAAAIRPPGALPEPEFLSACVRCGLCVEACPYDMLHLATLDEPVDTGTPFFVARDKACEMCADIPCAQACPTGALSHDLLNIADARMGLAVFSNPETCYAMQGTGCRACYRACPIKDDAITMEVLKTRKGTVFQPTVHSDACTGCGMCEEACITPEASIKVLPLSFAREDTGLNIHG